MTKLLTRKEAAQYLGISEAQLDAERKEGRIAYIQRGPGCKVIIPETAIENYLRTNIHRQKQKMMVTGETLRRRRV